MFEKTKEAINKKFGKTVKTEAVDVTEDSETSTTNEVAKTAVSKKGIATIITALAVYVGTKFGFDMPEDTTGNIVDAICVLVIAIASWKK